MNEYQAALETLQCKMSTNTDTCSANVKRRIKLCIRCDERKALSAIRELVDRATPKKPILANGNKCPNCSTLMQWEYSHCPFCGQAIDWSE